MEGATHFTLSENSDGVDITPETQLPGYLAEYEKESSERRTHMTPMMQQAVSLMDKCVLRFAALPHEE